MRDQIRSIDLIIPRLPGIILGRSSCTEAENPGEAHIRRAADALNARWHVLETDHYPMLSKPDELAGIIEGK
jgi:hypothetical protein